MMQTSLRLAALVWAALLVQGQVGPSLEGVVTDQDGGPVAGAVVSVEQLGVQAVTAADGRFTLSDLPLGTLRLQAEAPGYFPSEPIETELAAEGRTWIEIQLVAEPVYAETVVVTGTRTPHRIEDAPVRTEVVSGLVCQRRQARLLSEALVATVTGVRVEATCQNCGFLSVRLNGLEGRYTQILEDGLPTVSSVNMVYALEQLPTDFLDAIEVVKGGASALYGPSAVGGVINLTRREPRGGSASLDTQTGWQRGRPETSLGAMVQRERLVAGFSADGWVRSLRRTQIDRDGDGFTDVPRKRTDAGGMTLFRRFADGRARLTLSASLMDDFRRGGNSLDRPPEQTEITEMADSRRYGGTVRFNHSIDALTFYSLASSFQYLGRSSYYGSGFNPNAYGVTGNPLWVGDVQLGRQMGAHTLLAGWQFHREQVRDSFPAYRRDYRSVFANSGLYAQDEWRLGGRVTLVGGLRADKSNALAHWVLSPRGNLRLSLADRWGLRFGLSSGFRAPVIFEEDLHVTQVGGQGLLMDNAPGLREERSLSRNLSVDYAGSVGGQPLQVGAGLFWTSLRDVHLFREVSGAQQLEGFRRLERINGPGSEVRGVELDWNWRPRRALGLRGGVTLQQARYREPEPDFGSRRYFRTPNSYGFVAADADFGRGWELTLTGDFTGSMVAPHYAGYIAEDRLERTPAFAVWSAIVSRTLRVPGRPGARMRLSCRFTNLTDSFQRDLDRGPLRDSGYIYGPTVMRTLATSLTISF